MESSQNWMPIMHRGHEYCEDCVPPALNGCDGSRGWRQHCAVITSESCLSYRLSQLVFTLSKPIICLACEREAAL